MSITQDNYANMLKRLDMKSKFSSFVLTYYSISMIIYSITGKFFPTLYNGKLSEYFNIIISIVVLVYSISSANANYQERKRSAENILNEIKGLKRVLREDNLKKISEQYQKITCSAEYRADVDFFRTIKQRCKQLDIRWYLFKYDLKRKNNLSQEKQKQSEKMNNYLSEISPFFQQLKIVCDNLLMMLILLMPAAIFVVCLIIPLTSIR